MFSRSVRYENLVVISRRERDVIFNPVVVSDYVILRRVKLHFFRKILLTNVYHGDDTAGQVETLLLSARVYYLVLTNSGRFTRVAVHIYVFFLLIL